MWVHIHYPAIASLSDVLDTMSEFGDLFSFWAKVIIGSLFVLLIYGAIFYLIYYLFSLPLRRQERIRFLLEMIESSHKSGTSAEQSLVMLALSGDEYFGTRLQILAERLVEGVRLDRALKELPKAIPREILAMLEVGAQTGTLHKVLPACRKVVSDGSSRLTGASNYLLLLALMLNPMGVWVLPFLTVVIFPKFREIFYEMLEAPLPPLVQFLIDHRIELALIQVACIGVVLAAAVLYVSGPLLASWLGPVMEPVCDFFWYLIPWRRRRLQRDFSAMLAVLLDADIPEVQAVTLAAQATSNRILIQRSRAAVAALGQGVPLPEAVQKIDDTGEFRWRLRNATHAHTGFATALAGWHNSLDAKAYQQEQATAQVVTTALVLLNGVAAALIAIAIFDCLTKCVQHAALW